MNEFEQAILKQVANSDVKIGEVTEKNVTKNTIGAIIFEETENERKIRIGEMTPFGTVDTLENIERYSIFCIIRR